MPDVGGPETWRLIPGIARSGFIIQPTITTLAELDAFLNGHGRRYARASRLDTAPGQREYSGDMHVRISQVANLSLSTEAAAALRPWMNADTDRTLARRRAARER